MTYSVAVIGSTGKGNYGHRLDTAFRHLDNAEIVAVADAGVGSSGGGARERRHPRGGLLLRCSCAESFRCRQQRRD